MDRKQLIAGATVAVLALGGGGAAIAAQQAQEEENVKGITAPQGSGEENEAAGNEENEARGLKKLARIDRPSAQRAALGAVPGKVREVELENEGGFVVYEVEVAGNDGGLHEIGVDADNGEILGQEIEGGEGPDEDAE